MKKRGRIPLGHPELELPEVRKLWQTDGLFSDHYLRSRIQKNDWWPADDIVRPLWQFCVDLFNRRYVPCAQNNEAFTRQELINPILAKLGFAWTDNLSLPDQDAEPDYILFADAAEKEKVISESREKRFKAASTLLEAKKVNHPLSQISKHQQRYPHQQIRDYLQEAQVLGWGILANGNEWRLYCRDAKPSHFFSINFAVAIQSLENFKYFAALFNPAAFVRDAAGKCRLDAVCESALAAQIELEADLRQRVFTLVEILANGFAERPDNMISDNPEGHRLLYENCLIFLYRLLFILYAEGRMLLPVELISRKYYKDFSLARLVLPLKGFTEFDSQTRTRLHEDIIELCHLINGTDEAKNKEYSVPRYNGGLFDPDRFPNLEKWRICDAKLAEILRGLMFAKPDRHVRELPLETVDYADLRVQQLGSIYEGLLEHHFTRNNAGHLELQTDKAERKATGTYYTPDYIVHYIVEHTLGPLVVDIEQRPEVKQRKDNSFADAVLNLNICDPAMGSGHFLVEATSWLADQIVYHPTTKYQAVIKHGESQEQAEIAYWRRRVVEACIYGVDLNPLAVELAKLSLWLTTIASDQPLNFLDHHLRCGNSLIGARLDQISRLPSKKDKSRPPGVPAQGELTFGPNFKNAVALAIRQIQEIEDADSTTVAKVKDKEKVWGQISKSLAPYKSVADLWTSTFFGQPLDEETYIATAQKILTGNNFAKQTAVARHFFNWELEFPEVFFATDGTPKPNPGFDAVIGNPPYLPNEETEKDERGYYPIFYPVASGKYDTSPVFVLRGAQLLCDRRRLGFILPQTWQTGDNYVPFRENFVRGFFGPHLVINLPFNVFPDAYVDTCIALFTKPSTMACRVYSYPKKAAVAELKLSEKDFQAIPAEMIAGDAQFRLVPKISFYLLSSKFSVAEFVSLGTLAEACQGPVESFFKYSDVRENDDFLPYRSCLVYRYKLENLETRFIHFGRSNSLAKFYTQPRIFIRRIVSRQNRLMATYTNEPFVVKKDLNPFIPRDKAYSPLFLLSLVNSRLLSHLYMEASAIAGKDDFRQTTIASLAALPIRRIAFATAAAERKRLTVKGQKLYESVIKKIDSAIVLKFAEQQLTADHSDVVHDLLVFLAEQMIELNRNKQAAARHFLTDLKDFYGIDAQTLSPKTKLDQFWRLATGDLFAHLRSNAKRLAQQGIHLKETDEDKLRQRFETAQKKIAPLEGEIAFTDNLIDQIVYRLYGLTPEEIKIVEETRK